MFIKIIFIVFLFLQGCTPLVWTCYKSTDTECVKINCNKLPSYCQKGDRIMKYYPEKTATIYNPENTGKCFKIDK